MTGYWVACDVPFRILQGFLSSSIDYYDTPLGDSWKFLRGIFRYPAGHKALVMSHDSGGYPIVIIEGVQLRLTRPDLWEEV